jgi:hypothetical protein
MSCHLSLPQSLICRAPAHPMKVWLIRIQCILDASEIADRSTWGLWDCKWQLVHFHRYFPRLLVMEKATEQKACWLWWSTVWFESKSCMSLILLECVRPQWQSVHLNEYKEWIPGQNILEGSMWLAQQPAMRSQNVLMFPSELPAHMPNIILFLALDWLEYSWCGV